MKATIYHNPKCSKSRATLALLRARGIAYDVVDYLRDPPGRQELQGLLDKLGVEARDIVRVKEPEFAQSGLGADATDAQLLDLLVTTPKLLERPIVVYGQRARIGRPPERVLELFENAT